MWSGGEAAERESERERERDIDEKRWTIRRQDVEKKMERIYEKTGE